MFEGAAGRQAAKHLRQSVERAALIAIAFCSAHKLAVEELLESERLIRQLAHREGVQDDKRSLLLLNAKANQEVRLDLLTPGFTSFAEAEGS